MNMPAYLATVKKWSETLKAIIDMTINDLQNDRIKATSNIKMINDVHNDRIKAMSNIKMINDLQNDRIKAMSNIKMAKEQKKKKNEEPLVFVRSPDSKNRRGTVHGSILNSTKDFVSK